VKERCYVKNVSNIGEFVNILNNVDRFFISPDDGKIFQMHIFIADQVIEKCQIQ
jgi:hypothetical protein